MEDVQYREKWSCGPARQPSDHNLTLEMHVGLDGRFNATLKSVLCSDSLRYGCVPLVARGLDVLVDVLWLETHAMRGRNLVNCIYERSQVDEEKGFIPYEFGRRWTVDAGARDNL